MSFTIPFSVELEAMLRTRAAETGKDVDTFVREAVEEKLAQTTGAEKTGEQWALEFDAWMREVAARASNYPAGFVVDDRRDTIYEGRGE